ncbi:hypothetical protein [Azospirillum sp. sgz302134]
MPEFWEAAPVLKQDDAGTFWQSAPLVTQDVSAVLDKRTGAPINVRAAVGAANTPEDRLATLRRFYPDAKPYGDDNFVFNDPRHGGRPTLYNEENRRFLGISIPSVGDVISVGPEIAEAVGGAGGVAAATMATPVTGGTSLLTTPAAAGLGAAAGREGYNLLAQALLGTQDTRGLAQRLTDTVITTGVNAVGQRAGELVGKGIEALAGVANRYVRNADLAPGRQALTDFANAAVEPPTAGTVTGNRSLQIVESAMSNTPGGSSVMQEAADRSLLQLRGSADDLAGRIATADGANPAGRVLSPQGAGEVIEEGGKAAGQRFADRVQQLGNDLYRSVGADRRVDGAGVRDALEFFQDKVAADPGLRRTYQPILRELEDVVAGADMPVAPGVPNSPPRGITFGGLHRLRMKVGEALPQPDASDYRGVTGEELGRVYAALTGDMMQAAEDAGPNAVKALHLHDRYIRMQQNINMPALNALNRTAGAEAAFNWAMAASKDGGSRLFALRRNLRPEEWDEVAAAAFDKLGRPRPGAAGASDLGEMADEFSANTFLTNWNKLSPEARRALFAGTRYGDIVPELENLARVTARLKDAQRMANPSGTARNLLAAAGIGAAANEAVVNGNPGGAALGLTAGVIAPRVMAKLLTNPRTIRWLADGARVSLSDPNGVASHLARLTAIAKAEPDLRDAAAQYYDAVRFAMPATAQASSSANPRR